MAATFPKPPISATNLPPGFSARRTPAITASGSRFIQVRKIQYVLAAGPYTEFFVDDGSKWMMLRSIKEWRARLPRNQFAAIHRSTIVNLDFVEQMELLPNYSYRVVLRGSKCHLVMSRRRAQLLKERMA